MKQEMHKEYHREGYSVRYHFGEALPSEDIIRGWPPETAVYHIADTIKRMEAQLDVVRKRRDSGNTLYRPTQLLSLLDMIKGEKALLHEIIHPMTH